MDRKMTILSLMGMAILLGVPVFSDEPLPSSKKVESFDRKFAEQAAKLSRAGWNFDRIFTDLCKTTLSNLTTNPRLRLDDQVRSMFGGLWIWGRNGGQPTLQGYQDKALHFIGGGAFQGYWDVGRSAAVVKEQIDRKDPNNFFDLDDMAATMMGARWMDLATADDPDEARRWVELWASGQYTLSRSLPKMNFGHMQPGKTAPPEKIKAVQDTIAAQMKLPAETK